MGAVIGVGMVFVSLAMSILIFCFIFSSSCIVYLDIGVWSCLAGWGTCLIEIIEYRLGW